MRYRSLLVVLLVAVAAPLAAQEAGGTIDPGMSHDDVVKRLGKPLNERSSGTHTCSRLGCCPFARASLARVSISEVDEGLWLRNQ